MKPATLKWSFFNWIAYGCSQETQLSSSAPLQSCAHFPHASSTCDASPGATGSRHVPCQIIGYMIRYMRDSQSGGSPKPWVSILKWSNFGWFGGTRILGHLQLSINVLAVSCFSWELLLFDLPIQNNNYPDNIMQPSEPGHHRLILLSKFDFSPETGMHQKTSIASPPV